MDTHNRRLDGITARHLFSAATIAAAALALAACGDSTTVTSQPLVTKQPAVTSTPNSVAPSTPSFPTSAPVPLIGSGTFTLIDRQHYQLGVHYEFRGGKPYADATNSPPGQTVVIVPGLLVVTIANATDGRNTELDPLYLTPYGIYPAGSPACAVAKADQRPDTLNSGQCLVQIGPSLNWEAGSDVVLGPDEHITQTTEALSNNPLAMAAMKVSESKAPTLMASLEHPQQILLLGADPDSADGRWTETPKSCTLHYDTIMGDGVGEGYGAKGLAACT